MWPLPHMGTNLVRMLLLNVLLHWFFLWHSFCRIDFSSFSRTPEWIVWSFFFPWACVSGQQKSELTEKGKVQFSKLGEGETFWLFVGGVLILSAGLRAGPHAGPRNFSSAVCQGGRTCTKVPVSLIKSSAHSVSTLLVHEKHQWHFNKSGAGCTTDNRVLARPG